MPIRGGATPQIGYNDSQYPQGGQGNQYPGGSGSSDPFAYTGGSLLTPWDTKMPDIPKAHAATTPVMSMGFGGFNFRDPGTFSGQGDFNDKFSFDKFTPGADYKADQVHAPDAFAYNGPQVAGPYAKGNIDSVSAPGQFSYNQMQAPDRFTGPGSFTAPKLDETNDPGYALRQKEGQDALMNRAGAMGTLRGGDTMKALMKYNQDYASNEYDKVYGRAFGQFNQDYANKQSAFQTDANAQLAYGTQNFAQGLGAYQANTSAAQNAQAMNLQAQTANENAAQQAYGLNLQGQNQQFQQQLQPWQMQAQMGQQAQMANQGANLQTANMNSQNALAAYNANFNTANAGFNNDLNAHNANFQNALGGFKANTDAALGAGNLGWQVASGTYDRNYQNALNVNQQQRANAAAGASAANQNYSRAMQQYGMAYDMYRQNQGDQFDRLMRTTGVGQNAMGQVGAMGDSFANNMANSFYGQGNAQAAASMARGNAWANGANAVGGAVSNGIMMGSEMNPFNSPGGSGNGGWATGPSYGDFGTNPLPWGYGH